MATNDVGVIDTFLNTFTTTIDSGFGLVKGNVISLAGTLSVLDIALAGLFWAWAADEDIIQRLVKKTLYIGFFAFLINNFDHLAKVVFDSFAAMGLKAGGGNLTLSDFLRPGRLAATGFDAAQPLLESVHNLLGPVAFFKNFIQIFVLCLSWLIVLAAFFILAVQLFVALIEFKLTSLAGFVLIPFALFNRTAFLAEKVLGNVVSSGAKVMVLAVISGIASVLFRQFNTSYGDAVPTIGQAVSVVLASVSIVGLSIYGGSIANGLISGAPQLGAGAAVGTGMAVGAMGAAAVAGVGAVASGGAAAVGATAAAARGGATIAGAANTAYSMGAMNAAGESAGARMTAGLGGVARAPGRAAANAVKSKMSSAANAMKQSYDEGARGAFTATGGRFTGGSDAGAGSADSPSGNGGGGVAGGGSDPEGTPPRWARSMKRRNAATHAGEAAHVIRSADGGSGSSSIDLSEKE
ncbi:conjugal transfer protein TrbL [Gluconacetobacter liquefaciens]|uniref:P-type conjugative transfer protein TrbL n=1 Tax=Gluconacetobacter liquefaciens TaxID=89584 RepID=A0A370FYH4_GLULI|nr:P-type conjugative transfer protein TrbL [Gluconacetobacter liquefaciens]MBB2187855.1 P-type conjugative transfer protein TrbL [Gluconacetobacter liquefaciens]RDI32744.1 type IV secretion system protein TrbL [Gluconacetobacter liquefaciens]GBR12516.1 conjugal transfer protein TrbL [Gluconacetobacter liquefaciens NRIC 0522]GEB39233.1 conjugal transfer protein TrbL [Gluconacetobacter liquefaciens]